MKKLLLVTLVAGVIAFVPMPRADAGVSVGIGFGFPVGYYGYPYYPYYGPYPYYGYYAGPSFYWYGGRRHFVPARVHHRVHHHHR
jgi:hypothetical protein